MPRTATGLALLRVHSEKCTYATSKPLATVGCIKVAVPYTWALLESHQKFETSAYEFFT